MQYRWLSWGIPMAFVMATLGCSDPDPDNSANNSDQNQNEEQNPGGNENQNPGGNENQNPGGNENQNPGGNENQNPGDGTASTFLKDCKPGQDEATARKLINGEISPDEGFNSIAYSCGLPVITSDNKAIFLHWYKGGNWSVAGAFNNWEQVAMTKHTSEEFWYAEVTLGNKGEQLPGYKFVNDGQYQSDPWSLRYNYDEHGEISFYQDPGTAHLMRWRAFGSPQGLQTRDIYAWVPGITGTYDVLYAHDGQNLFDPGSMGGGWKLRENLAQIEADFIVVGIPNTTDRFQEYTHVNDTIEWDGGMMSVEAKGDVYGAFIDQSVRPFIESKFSTTETAGLMGSSLGGLISLYVALLYPDRYKAALALSPTTAWGHFSENNTLIQEMYEKAEKRPYLVYLDSGGGAGANGCQGASPEEAREDEYQRDNYCYTNAMKESLANLGYEYEKTLYHWHEPNAEHNEAAWAKRVFRPLEIFKNL